ncbi:MAG: hypothetical protein DRG58_10740 [Deltaproteobacteria bacterium]|nr:MAG: hypothetical protein DRG58_10740 [Deltaproteobacteria bacterium]
MPTNEAVNKPTPDREEVHLMDYFLVLARHSQMIIFASTAVAMVTLLVLLCVPNQYTATASSFPPQQNITLSAQLLENLGGSGSALPAGGSGLGGKAAGLLGLQSSSDLYIGCLTGNTIFNRIIERFNLREVYDTKYFHDARQKLRSRAEITLSDNGLIIVAVSDEDPRRAAEMANAFMEELDKLLQEMARKEAKDRLAFLEKERNQASVLLARSEEALCSFSEKSNVIQLDEQTKGAIEYIANLRASIDAKEVQLKVLRQKATPYNPEVLLLETELEGLKEKLRTVETQADKTCFGDVCITTSKVPVLGLEYFRLYRETKYQEALYQLYCKLVELARLDEVRDAAIVQVVDQAGPPEKKSKPKRTLIAGLGGIATFFTMIFFAFVAEYWQNTIRSESNATCLKQISKYLQQWRQEAQYLLFWRKNSSHKDIKS